MPVDANFKETVELGRGAVDTYRTAHAKLHSQGWYPQIHADHSPLLKGLADELNARGFNSIADFFSQSELLNITELGFADGADFEARSLDTDRQAPGGEMALDPGRYGSTSSP